MDKIPDRFYRISIKALIINEAGDKFLICKEDNGRWELPGGGLEWGTTPHEDLPREIEEEMGLETTWIADNPSYFYTFEFENHPGRGANVIYEATVKNLNFTPSDECVEIAFVNKETVGDKKLFSVVAQLLETFKPENHKR